MLKILFSVFLINILLMDLANAAGTSKETGSKESKEEQL